MRGEQVHPVLCYVRRLTANYRAAVGLCYLEGHTQEEAARRLGCPRKTITTRLARACDRLRPRLLRQGVTLSAAGVAAALAEGAAPAAGPPALAEATVR